MATSIIKLYKTKLTPTRNALIEDIEDYLSTCQSITVNDFQYIKHNLNISIKLDMSQKEALEPSYNYVSIKNSDSNRTFYYFIINPEWRAQQTVQLQLSIDSVNTFYDKINNWTPKTKILRQHENRFEIPASVSSYSTVLNRRISKTEEIINNVATELVSDEAITANDNNKWYLVYQSNAAITTTDTVNPIYCYLVPQNSIPVTTGAGTLSIYSDSIGSNRYYVTNDGAPTGTITYYVLTTPHTISSFQFASVVRNGSTLQLVVDGIDKGINITAVVFNNIRYYYLNTFENKVIVSDGTVVFSKTINNIDRTDTKLVKIVECPYCPVEYTIDGTGIYQFGNNWSVNTDGYIQLSNLSAEFEKVILDTDLDNMTVRIPAKSQRWNQEPLTTYESKLYNSNFNNLVYQYDSDSIAVRREAVSNTDNAEIILKYKQANTITSNLLFDAIINGADYTKNSPQELLMLSNRNNEMPLYNSAYLNYLRTGYNYDMKSRKQQLVSNIIGTTINTAGAAASLGFGAAKSSAVSSAAGIGLVTNTINSIVGTINSYITATNAINQKKKETMQQAVNIVGSDDLNLLNYYNGNRIHKLVYRAPENLEHLLFELFRLTGYSCEKYGLPDINSRRWFNFIQCEPVWSTDEDSEWLEYVDDAKTRFSTGITVYHKARNAANGDYVYDFSQSYENYEIAICER